MSIRSGLVTLGVLGLATAASAQVPFSPQLYGWQRAQQYNQAQRQAMGQMQSQPHQVNFTGTIERASRGYLQVAGGDQQSPPWQVYLTPETTIHLTGTAESDFLKRGLTVEFQADLDAQGKGSGELGDLTLIGPRDKRLGVSEAASGGVQVAARKGASDGERKAAKAPVHNGSEGKGIEPGPHHVIGRVVSFNKKDNLLIVQAPRSPHIQVKLAESPKITVDMSNLAYAAEGDKVTVRGLEVPNRTAIQRPARMFQPPFAQNPRGIQNQMAAQGSHIVQAQEVKVEKLEPLSGVRKKATPRTARKDGADHAKKKANRSSSAEE